MYPVPLTLRDRHWSGGEIGNSMGAEVSESVRWVAQNESCFLAINRRPGGQDWGLIGEYPWRHLKVGEAQKG